MKKDIFRISAEDISKRIESNRIPPSPVRDLVTGWPVKESEIQQYEKDIVACNSFEELYDYIQNNPVLLKNSYAGLDHVEHTLKRIELARIFTSSSLVPEYLGIKKKVSLLLEKEGRQDVEHPDNEAYKTFLQNRFPDMQLSEKEASRLSEKIPANLFGSLDLSAERVMVVLNSIEGVQTRYSCGGHNDQPELYRSGTPNFGSAYVVFEIENPEFIAVVKNTLPNQIGEQTFISLAHDEKNRINIQFHHYPPDEWVVSNNRQSISKIFEDSQREIKKLLGREISPESLVQSIGETLPDMIQRFSKRAAKEIGDEVSKRMRGKAIEETRREENKQDTKVQKILPGILMSQEYREYFVSDEAREKVKDFFSRIERIAQGFREKV
ncbi:MAG: hypothetical protein Q7R79_05025 [bacterium]|nr:hypothetical protein [bacterium]